MKGGEAPISTSASTSDRERSRAAARGVGARFFDLWSEVYDVGWVQQLAYRPVHDAVIDALVRRPRRAVLDLACGTGLLTRRMRETLPGARIMGCDFSSGMLEHARRADADLAWVQGNALALPFAEGRFDTVVSTEAFHWFPQPRTALAEIHRALEPGGQLLLAFINPPSPLLSEMARVGSRLIGDPVRWPTRPRLRGWLEAAGFRIESQRRISRLPAGILLPPVLTSAVRPASAD